MCENLQLIKICQNLLSDGAHTVQNTLIDNGSVIFFVYTNKTDNYYILMLRYHNSTFRSTLFIYFISYHTSAIPVRHRYFNTKNCVIYAIELMFYRMLKSVLYIRRDRAECFYLLGVLGAHKNIRKTDTLTQ